MKILMLAQFYPPLMGGIERHVQNLSLELAERGHQIVVVTLWHASLPEIEEQAGVKIYRVRGTMQRLQRLFTTDRQHSPPFPDLEVTLALRQIIRQEQPDIVHGHDWMVRSFLPLKPWGRAKLVRTLHDCELSCAQMRYMYMDTQLCVGPSPMRCMACVSHHYGRTKGTVTLLSNWVFSRLERLWVDTFIPVSSAIARANQLDLQQPNVSVIPNFVPDHIAAKTNQSSSEGILPPPGFILQVGDLVPDKGINVLIEAYAGLQSPPPLVLIGRRSAQSPKQLPPGVTIIESLPHPLIMQAWQRCLCGTVASTCLDASPTVTLEAMAAGRPVVGSRLGGITDQIIDGQTGFLVEPGNVTELRQALARLINDPLLCEQLGRAAKARVKAFQSTAVVEQIEDIYGQLDIAG